MLCLCGHVCVLVCSSVPSTAIVTTVVPITGARSDIGVAKM